MGIKVSKFTRNPLVREAHCEQGINLYFGEKIFALVTCH